MYKLGTWSKKVDIRLFVSKFSTYLHHSHYRYYRYCFILIFSRKLPKCLLISDAAAITGFVFQDVEFNTTQVVIISKNNQK